jgi:hypothetical protein
MSGTRRRTGWASKMRFPNLTCKRGRCWGWWGRRSSWASWGQGTWTLPWELLFLIYEDMAPHPHLPGPGVLAEQVKKLLSPGGSDCEWGWRPHQTPSIRDMHPRCGNCWHGPSWIHLDVSKVHTPETKKGPCTCSIEWLGISTQLFCVQFNLLILCIFYLYLFNFLETFKTIFPCENVYQDIWISTLKGNDSIYRVLGHIIH